METKNDKMFTEDELTLSSENISTYSTTATDYSEDIDMPFRHWVKGIYENFDRKYKFIANAPGAHINGGKGLYIIRYNGTRRATLDLYDYTGDRIKIKTGGHFNISVELEYNKDYHFTITGLPYSTDPFEVRIDYRGYTSTDPCGYLPTLEPHGNYLTFTCEHAAVCNDGVGESHGDIYHQSQTSYMNGILNADIHRYIVIPRTTSNYAGLLGCVGVAVRENGSYVFGVVGEVGPKPKSGILDEFSKKMIDDLGFETDGANYVRPEESVTTYIFPDTKRSTWNGDTLNDDVETVGMEYFY